jgi:1-acyl-sn-glycerol-3-phosphate acyltransferase
VRPSPEQLALLNRTERVSFEIADFLAQHKLTPASEAYLTLVLGAIIWSCGGRRLDVRGIQQFDGMGKKDRVIIVANHRSFFDFFSITAILYWRTNLTKRIFFPTRSTFFYDHPAGPAVNLAMSAMRMFPPILRDKKKSSFNDFAMDRLIEELKIPGTIVGVHPEGTRNKSEDPYELLPAQIGVGKLALNVDPEVKVIPAFVLGMGNSLPSELKMNVLEPEAHKIDLFFGAPIDFSDLRAKGARLATYKRAADRCMEHIKALAERQRQESGA